MTGADDTIQVLSPEESAAAIGALSACSPINAAIAPAQPPAAVNLDRLLNGISRDPRYARAAEALPRIVAHLSLADPNAPQVSLRLHMQRAAELRDWIEHGLPMVNA